MTVKRAYAGLTGRLAEWPTWRWKVIGVGGGLLGTALVGMVLYQIAPDDGQVMWTAAGGVFGGAWGAGGVLALYVILRQYRRLERSEAQIRALVNVRPLTGRCPVDLGEWAVDPVLADEIVRVLIRREAQTVVECGSGWSTVLIASCLSQLGDGQVVALEHEERFAERTRRLLLRFGGKERASVVHAPLADRMLDGETRLWYSQEAEDAITDQVNLLLVDGPPGDVTAESRYPAVPLLRDHLASDAIVILDDGRREDEARIAEGWERDLGVAGKFVESASGHWMFELGG